MLLPALDATANCGTELYIHSPDTDVLVLPLRRYPEPCVKTSFVAGTGNNHRVIGLGQVVTPSAVSVKRAVSPAFHAFNGADITGRFSGRGKLSCWKTFMDAEENTITALRNVGTVWRSLYASFISLEPVSRKSRI